MTPTIDPRRGDIEDDASSPKRRSMLSLAGSLLVEISIPKLVVAWSLLIVFPGLMLGLAPIVASIWFGKISDRTRVFIDRNMVGDFRRFLRGPWLVRRPQSFSTG